MSTAAPTSILQSSVPNRTGIIPVYLFYAAIFARTILMSENPENTLPYIIANLLLVALFSLCVWRPNLPMLWLHLITAALCILIVYIQSLDPDEDATNALFVLVGYLVGFLFKGRMRWMWALAAIALCGLSLIFNAGVLEGLAKSLLNIAGIIMLVAYFALRQEIDEARAQSQVMLVELEESHKKLEAYTSQVEELSAAQERNRLARELHDSVSQTMFSIILNTRAAQMLQERNPARLRQQLEVLHSLSQNALLEMRSLISELRPKRE